MKKIGFEFKPVTWLPYHDDTVIRKVRQLSLQDMEKHSWENPNFLLRIVPEVRSQFVIDLFERLRKADINNEKLTIILPGDSAAVLENVAALCNKYAVNCRNLHVFFTSEWADETGKVAPLSYEASKGRLFRKYFYGRLNADLRPPEEQIHYFTNENINVYSDLIGVTGNGGADICYTSTGWSGRLEAIEPAGEFACATLQEYLLQKARIVTNNIITTAEESMRGIFASSGNLAAVPPKSASIGPRDIVYARDHMELQDKTDPAGQFAWQCMSLRLMLFGPITPSLPGSILRLFKGICYVSETVAKEIKNIPDVPDEKTFGRKSFWEQERSWSL